MGIRLQNSESHSSADGGHACPWRGAHWRILDTQIERIDKSNGKSWTDSFKELHTSTSFSLQLS